MKYLLIGIITCSFLACKNERNNTDKESGRVTNLSDKIIQDFEFHFRILDSAKKASPNDTIYACCNSAIAFMEINTGISTHSDGSLLGKFEFTKNDLQGWHEWFKKNGDVSK